MKDLEIRKLGLVINAGVKVTVAAVAAMALAGAVFAHGDRHDEGSGHRPPAVPDSLKVPAGQRLVFHASAVGVQIYTCTQNPTNAAQFDWVFKAPHAVLLDDCEVVGIHFAGPAWEANDGSKVIGKVLQRATVDSNSIPWLLLQATSNTGEGLLTHVTYVQRLRTFGGNAPATGADAAHAGQEVLVPYLAEYYFYEAAR
jgi:hypothetical protein